MEMMNGTFIAPDHNADIFLLVAPPENEETSVVVGHKMDALSERIMTGYDCVAIEEVVQDKGGFSEIITEVPENKADISVMVFRDRMEAYLQIELPSGAKPPDKESVLNKIKEAGVQYGILEDAVDMAMHQPGLRMLCASGTQPENGSDAKIEMFVNMGNIGKPVVLANGSVDFKNIGMYVSVEKGQVLARKIPATSGVAGMDVLGTPVKAKSGKDVPLQPGVNLQVAGNTLVAVVGGNLSVAGGKMSISPVLQVKSDVDLSTGNIEFSGDVVVQGSVQEGFHVKAGGNVDIAGVVSGGCVEGSNVTVRLGIMGMNRGKISASGNVVAKFIENATVEAGNDILVNDVVLHSNLRAGNTIRVEGKRGQIVGGMMAAGNEIIAKIAGAESTIVTELQVGVNPKLRTEYCCIRKDLKPLEASLDQLQKGLIMIHSIDQSQLTPEKKEMLLKLTRTKFVVAGQVEAKKNRLCELEVALGELKGGQIRIADYVFPGVKLVIGSLMRPIQDITRYVSYYADEGDIRIRPYK